MPPCELGATSLLFRVAFACVQRMCVSEANCGMSWSPPTVCPMCTSFGNLREQIESKPLFRLVAKWCRLLDNLRSCATASSASRRGSSCWASTGNPSFTSRNTWRKGRWRSKPGGQTLNKHSGLLCAMPNTELCPRQILSARASKMVPLDYFALGGLH